MLMEGYTLKQSFDLFSFEKNKTDNLKLTVDNY